MPSRAQWLRRLASRRRDRVAFVLSGGGPLGALQVGGLSALFDHGIVPDIVVGTSVGALNGSFMAFDPTPHGARRLEGIWLSLRDGDLFPGSRFMAPWARFLARGNRVFDNHGIARLIDDRLGPEVRFEDAQIPLGVVAADQLSGTERVFSSGPLRQAVIASTAMPGIYPPVEIEGRMMIDGGVANNVPIAPAIDMGASVVYVLDATSWRQAQRPLARPIDHLLHAFSLARSQRLRIEMDDLTSKARVVMLPLPRMERYVPFTSLAHTADMITESYESVTRYLNGEALLEEDEESIPS